MICLITYATIRSHRPRRSRTSIRVVRTGGGCSEKRSGQAPAGREAGAEVVWVEYSSTTVSQHRLECIMKTLRCPAGQRG